MGFSKLFTTILVIEALFLLRPPTAAARNSNHFGEYIGAEFKGVKFSDVPINPGVDFHFILAFAIDYTTSSPHSPPTEIQRVLGFGQLGSLPGLRDQKYTLKRKSSSKPWRSHSEKYKSPLQAFFCRFLGLQRRLITYPTNQTVPPGRHRHRLRKLRQRSRDLHPVHRTLVTTLKNNKVISFASIAPFDDPNVQKNYLALMKSYGNVIDYVNFQFYGYSAETTVAQFVKYYETQSSNYGNGKVLASFISDGSSGLSPQKGFFQACQMLKNRGELAGIFVYSADDSKENGFQYEKQAQALLA